MSSTSPGSNIGGGVLYGVLPAETDWDASALGGGVAWGDWELRGRITMSRCLLSGVRSF